MTSQKQAFLKFAHFLADQAAPTLKAYFRTPIKIEDKSDSSPVTKADKTTEQYLRRLIEQHFPEHDILGEEFDSSQKQARFQWVLDPIDGTRSYITGRPLFGTLIALFEDDKPILGVIDQPITHERWSALKGEKTVFSSPLGGTIGTRQTHLEDAELSCTSPEMLDDAPTQRWRHLKKAAKRISWGGDCYNYGLLAIGGIDLIMECDMNPWDWGALVPIVEGAGGIMTQWNGAPLSKEGDRTVLAASCPQLHKEAVAQLYPS